MTAVRSPNHPATFNGHFQPISESVAESVRANQYGYVKTPSFIQCAGSNGDKNEDFEVELVTNTALTNTLNTDSIYAISGKIIALNNGSTPMLSYFQDTVVRIGASSPDQPDFSNKTIVTSLGMVTSRCEVANGASDSGSQLEVIVAHCDWDGEERIHRRFNIKYIVPGSKNLVKTHTLYQAGREVNIIGRLVDFDIEDHMAIVVVSSVSITSGHQIGRPIPAIHGQATTSSITGRKFTSFSAKMKGSPNNSPPTEISKTTVPNAKASSQPDQPNPQSTPSRPGLLNKGKARALDAPVSHDEEATEDETESDSAPEPETTPNPKIKRGRPRKSIIQDAAKRMKKY
ncbi:uncharacterized protein PGTG_03854 [Puccinia graminis f. sp. tritici CRL 75-36-700-3]|uniref:Uncharacterized protein n=1 Tax=Puccinia graminis f. sp. tritici (strain CRL 75-36-700-3 / race SCCL) TaxID=418459 RepID=E3K0S3_PUCGT|nr:uncharacterized protein PGTG_03854 [Puccinia graminis f. sp. tritici CRL 75-36-700-3]EFP77898.2 hypothetical protein PGTG_03854 [Puccinia graminis f. sp. tritici CRL 75-36-700-3]